MKKIYSFFMALCLSAMMLNAKTVETTLWEGEYNDGVEINSAAIATFQAGDILRVYVTVPKGGANFKIVYKGAPDWSETTIPSINNQWPWVNGGETYMEFALTEEDLTALAGKNIYVYKGENSTIDKVSLLTELKEMTETTLWQGEYTGDIELNAETVASFQAGDILRVYVAPAAKGGNIKLVYKGELNRWSETALPSVGSTWPWINGGEERLEVTFTQADISALNTMNIYLANGGRSILQVTLLTEDKGATTGIDNSSANSCGSQKILRDGQLYILYNGAKYNVHGQLIK